MATSTDPMARLGRQIPQLTLMFVVIAVLAPAVNYSIRLNNPTPPQLLVAICIGVFSSVVCLWLLDAVSLLRFRSDWVARSVWAAAIASILGTGVGVFGGAFAERRYPFEGPWFVRVYSATDKMFIAEPQAVLTYREPTESYWGFSQVSLLTPANPSKAISVEVKDFEPSKPHITLSLLFANGNEIVLDQDLVNDQRGARFKTAATGTDMTISLSRP